MTNENLPVEIQEFEPDQAIARINKAIDFIGKLREVLKSGEDYNKHPGYQKPALEKPGAEKIAAALNCGPEIIRGEEGRVIDEQYGLKEFSLVVGFINRSSGICYGQGVGYGRAAVKDLYAWDKKQGKSVLKPERAEWANNTALKMAFKSGLICAALSIGALSGYFTQDLAGVPKTGTTDVKKPSTDDKKPPDPAEEPQKVEEPPKPKKPTSWDVFWKSVNNAGYKQGDRDSMNEFIAHKSKIGDMSKTDAMIEGMSNFKGFIAEWEEWKK